MSNLHLRSLVLRTVRNILQEVAAACGTLATRLETPRAPRVAVPSRREAARARPRVAAVASATPWWLDGDSLKKEKVMLEAWDAPRATQVEMSRDPSDALGMAEFKPRSHMGGFRPNRPS